MSELNSSIVGIKDTTELRIDPATEEAQVVGNSSLASIVTNTNELDVALSTRASETTLLAAKTDLDKFTFDGFGNLKVLTAGSVSSSTPVNIYAENLVLVSGIETTIISYTVPVGKTLNVLKVIGWGTYEGEFLIRVNGAIKGGGRNSPTDRTLQITYSEAPIVANASDIVTLTFTEYSTATESVRTNLLGVLL